MQAATISGRWVAAIPLAIVLFWGAPSASAAEEGARRVLLFNLHQLTESEIEIIEELERESGATLADGLYWYDPRSGASGVWGGPAVAFLPPDLPIGGPLRSDCSGGGTGIFVNGRELHPAEVGTVGQPFDGKPGRYWLESDGQAGSEPEARITVSRR